MLYGVVYIFAHYRKAVLGGRCGARRLKMAFKVAYQVY